MTEDGKQQLMRGGASTGGEGRPARRGLRRLLPTWRMVVGGAFGVLVVLVGGFLVGYTLVSIPDPNHAATAQSNIYLYADGKTQLARDGEVNRESVSLSQVAKGTQHAVLSAEDRGFYHESAVSPKAMVRAAWKTATGKGKQSGSTITQQYVKNYYLNQEQTAVRKVKEFFIAIKLDRTATKNEILEGYLNTSYFGRNAYGVQAAAQAYFGKDAESLTTAQGAYLATLLNAPSEYDVEAHPENRAKAEARWDYVLDGMVKEGWLTASERSVVRFPEPVKRKASSGLSGQRGYVVDAVNRYLADNGVLDADTLATGGYRIVTTIEKRKEDAFVTAAQKQVFDRLGTSKADSYVRVGGASIDPPTGKVVALYGGVDYTKQYVSNATRHDYAVGSTFKPFIFASAVEKEARTRDGRRITPYATYNGNNDYEVVGSGGATGYSPGNEDGRSYGDITVTRAMDKSVNAVYAQMAQDVGTDDVKATAVALGLPEKTPNLTSFPSMALGTAQASPLDMASAYATLANHGEHVPYSMVLKITKDGAALSLPLREGDQAVSRQAADTTTSILRSVVDGGTATVAQNAGRPAAAKTGTIDEDHAAWFAGYTPDLATVVALMGADPETATHRPMNGAMGLPRINGGGPPGEVWAAYTASALEGAPSADFDLELEEGAEAPTAEPSASSPTPTDSPSSSASGTPETPSPSASTSTEPSPGDTSPSATEPTPTPTGTETQTLLPSGGAAGGGTGGTDTGGQSAGWGDG